MSNCEKCGMILTSPALGGLCPRCLMSEGLEEKPVGTGDTARISSPFFIRCLGDCELINEVARGGMGVIYRARQRRLGRIVAVKVLSAGEFASREYVERFRAEAAAAARLQHPNIVAIHDVGDQDGVQYFSMDFVEGPNLAELVRKGPMEPERAAHCLRALAEAIQYAHERGILHRDLKPSNVLMDPFGEPRISDFGLAKELSGDSDLTVTGQVLGTPGYLPPEQADAQRGPAGPGADIYSLGAVLYFMLTGRPPFVSESLTETLRQVLEADPVAPSLVNPSTPRDLETICLKCLEKEPTRRYTSASDLAAELDRFLAGEPIQARPINLVEFIWRWCRRQRALAAMGGAVLVLLLALAFGAPAAAVHIAAARDAEARERERAERTVNQLELQQAERLLWDDRVSSGLAHLAHVLRRDPTNTVAAARILSVLMQRSFPLPVCKPLQHKQSVLDVAFSADGRLVGTASADGNASVWEAATGHLMAGPFHQNGRMHTVRFSPDSGRLYTASSEKTIHTWDIARGVEIVPFFQNDDAVLAMELCGGGQGLAVLTAVSVRIWDTTTGKLQTPAFEYGGGATCFDVTPDGKLIGIGMGNGQIRFWDTEGARVIQEVSAHSRVQSIEFGAGGKLVTGAGYDGRVRVWEAASGRLVCEVGHDEVVQYATLSPDGKWLATASRDAVARIWEVKTGKPLTPPLRHNAVVDWVRFSPGGQRLLTRCWDNTAWVWDSATGTLVTEPIKHDNRIFSAQFSPDGARVLTGSGDRTAMIWDMRPGQQAPLTFRHNGTTYAQFNGDGTRLLTWAADGTARIWDPQTGKAVGPVLRHQSWIVTGKFSADGRKVVTASMDNTATIWDALTGTAIKTLSGHSNVVEHAEFSPDGQSVLTACRDGTAFLWSAVTGERRAATMQHQKRIWQAHFSPDGRRVVTSSADGTARIWDAATGAPVGLPLEHDGEVYSASFSPDNSRVVTASFDMSARIWDAATGQPLTRRLKHYSGLRWAEFSPDGQKVLTASGDNTARLWDAATGMPIGEPLQHEGELWKANFSGDGSLVVTVSHDGTTRVWSGVTGQPWTEPFRHGPGWFAKASVSANKRWLASGKGQGDAFLWELPELEDQAPGWLSDLAEAVAGERFSSEGLEYVSPAELLAIRAGHVRGPVGDLHERFIRWFFADRGTRPISPSSFITLPELIDRMAAENTPSSLRDARAFAPGRVDIRWRLARNALADEARTGSKGDPDAFTRWILASPEADWLRAERVESTNLTQAADLIRAAEPVLRVVPEFMIAKGRILSRANLLEAAHAAFARALELIPKTNSLARSIAAMGRRNVLLRMNRRDEAAADSVLPLKVPPRDSRTSAAQIDLSNYYNAIPEEPWHSFRHSDNSLKQLTTGPITAGPVVFDVRGLIQLSGLQIHPLTPGYPDEVTGIPIHRSCRYLHFFHGTGWGTYVTNGTTIGQYRVRFKNGTAETIPIIAGEDLEEWVGIPKRSPTLKHASVAWKGATPAGTPAFLYHRPWENPHPESEITSLDFISMGTAAAPFLIAVTVE